MRNLKNLVGGEFVDASDGRTLQVVNPASPQTVVGSVPAMTSEDITRIYEAAASGFVSWRGVGPLERGGVLLKAAELIRARKDELIEVIVSEMGKTRAEATGEVGKSAEFFEYYGGMGRDEFGQFIPDARPGTFAARLTEPLSVVLLITPWNDPLLTPARKLAPALIAGSAVIIKPATVTPLITLLLAEILHEAGVPAGALATVTGRGAEIGDALIEHPSLKAVSFTGSTPVGLRLQQQLAGRGVRVQTEMGGKNAAVVLDDADLDLAAPTILAGAFGQAGQRCTATSRLIVQRGVAAKLRERIAAAVRELTVGPGDSEGVDLGPVVDEGSRDSIRAHVSRAIEEGATVIAKSELGADTGDGYFVEPTFLDVSAQHTIWAEEVFGPVLGMIEVDSIDEAIEQVNNSSYGLSSAVFTRSLEQAFKFVDAVDTGQVSVNQPTSGWDIHHPFGGFKDSGSGYKEQGHDALTFFTRIKTAAIRTH